MRLGRTAVVHFGSQIAVSVSGFVATFAIARLLGAEVYGVYVTAVALAFWLNIPANAVGDAVVKRVSEGTDQGSYLSAGFLLNLAIAIGSAGLVAAGLLAVGGVPFLQGNAMGELASLWWLVGLLVLGNVAFLTVVKGLNGQKLVARGGLLKAGERVLRTVAQVGLILAGAALVGIVVGHILALVLAAALGLLLYEMRPAFPTGDHVRSLVAFARYAWLGGLKTRTFSWMDTIVLAVFVESALVGIYEVAWSLASLFALLSISIQSTLFPEMSDLSTRQDYDRIHHYLDEALTFAGLFIIPGLFGAAVIGDRVLKIYRPEFVQGAFVLVVLVFARTLAAYGSQLLSAINAVDRPDLAFRINLGFVGANMTLNVLLVWQFGWQGAAVATMLSAGLLLVLAYRTLGTLVGPPSVPVYELARQVIAATGMAGVVLILRRIAPQGHYATVGLVAFGAGIYVLALLGISTRVRGKVVGLLRGVAA